MKLTDTKSFFFVYLHSILFNSVHNFWISFKPICYFIIVSDPLSERIKKIQSNLFNATIYQIIGVFMGKYNRWRHCGEWEEEEGERKRSAD